MKRRITLLISVGLFMTAMLALVGPAFAQEGGADVTRIEENCGTGTELLGECQIVSTPSGNTIVWARAHPQTDGPAAGGGASHELDTTECASPHPAKGVTTPSGNVNVHCTGPPPDTEGSPE
jgi:hypothetical protein